VASTLACGGGRNRSWWNSSHDLHPAAERGGERLPAKADAEHGHAGFVRLPQPGQFLGDPGPVRAVVVDRPDGAEHHDVVDVVERGQRPLLREQAHGELGAARLERGTDEPGRILFVVADDGDSHEQSSPAAPTPAALPSGANAGGGRPHSPPLPGCLFGAKLSA
jgi:hypothetical protein